MKTFLLEFKKTIALALVFSMFVGTAFTSFSVNDFIVFAEGINEDTSVEEEVSDEEIIDGGEVVDDEEVINEGEAVDDDKDIDKNVIAEEVVDDEIAEEVVDDEVAEEKVVAEKEAAEEVLENDVIEEAVNDEDIEENEEELVSSKFGTPNFGDGSIPEGNSSVGVVFDFDGGTYIGGNDEDGVEDGYAIRQLAHLSGKYYNLTFPAVKKENYILAGWTTNTSSKEDFLDGEIGDVIAGCFSSKLDPTRDTTIKQQRAETTFTDTSKFNLVAVWMSIEDLDEINVRYNSANSSVDADYKSEVGESYDYDEIGDNGVLLNKFLYYPGYEFIGHSFTPANCDEPVERLTKEKISEYARFSTSIGYYVDVYSHWNVDTNPNHIQVPLVTDDGIVYCYGEIGDDEEYELGVGHEHADKANPDNPSEVIEIDLFYNPVGDVDNKWRPVTTRLPVDLGVGGSIVDESHPISTQKFVAYCGYDNKTYKIKDPINNNGKRFAGFNLDVKDPSLIGDYKKLMLSFKDSNEFNATVAHCNYDQNWEPLLEYGYGEHQPYHATAMYYDTFMDLKIEDSTYAISGVNGTYITLPNIEGVNYYTLEQGVQNFSDTYYDTVDTSTQYNVGDNILSNEIDQYTVIGHTNGVSVSKETVEEACKTNNIYMVSNDTSQGDNGNPSITPINSGVSSSRSSSSSGSSSSSVGPLNQLLSITEQGKQTELKANESLSKLSNEVQKIVKNAITSGINMAIADSNMSQESKEVAQNIATNVAAKMVLDMQKELANFEGNQIFDANTVNKLSEAAAKAAVNVAKTAEGMGVDIGVITAAVGALASLGLEIDGEENAPVLYNFASIENPIYMEQTTNLMQVVKQKKALDDENVIRMVLAKADDYTGPSDNVSLGKALGITNDKFVLQQDIYGRTKVLDTSGNVMVGFNKFNIGGQDKNYYLEDEGVIRTGWVKDAADTVYFFTPSGEAAVSQMQIGDKMYTFDNNGKLTTEVDTKTLNELMDLKKGLIDFARVVSNSI